MPEIDSRKYAKSAVCMALVIFAISGSLQPLRAASDEFCALTIKVVGSDGGPVNFTSVELLDPTGKTVRKEEMHGPEHKFCDFGFGRHTLVVGTNECLPVSVSNLEVLLGRPQTVVVVLNRCVYREMRSGCLAYFRTVAEDGTALPGVRFSPPLTVSGSETDAYGRWQGIFRSEHELRFARTGYGDTLVRIQCSGNEQVNVAVQMKKSTVGSVRKK